MEKLIPANLRVILVPLAIILVLIFLTILSFNIGFSKISEQREELSVSDKNETILKDKQSVLTGVANQILSFSDSSSMAVPSDNPAFVVLTQLKNLSNEKGVVLGNVKIGSPISDEGKAQRIEIGFDVDGTTPSVLSYVTSISGFSPLTSIQKVKMSQSQGAARASVTLSSFWAPFPTSLPALTEPLKAFSSDENKILTKLGALNPPPFIKMTPQAGSGRLDPFNF